MTPNKDRIPISMDLFRQVVSKQIALETMTVPSPWRKKIVCTDQCDQCPMYLRGCAKVCVRFPDSVCSVCPCRASEGAGDINPA